MSNRSRIMGEDYVKNRFSHLDAMKSNSLDSPNNDLVFDVLETDAEHLLEDGISIAHLFAGNAPEAINSLKFLQENGVDGTVFAVDKEAPNRDFFVDQTEQPIWVIQDAFDFLCSQEDLSLDVVTLQSAEYYFYTVTESELNSWREELSRVVKFGGLVYIPGLRILDGVAGWKRKINGVFQKEISGITSP